MYGLSLELRCIFLELVYYANTLRDIIVNVLSGKEFYSIIIPLTQKPFKNINIVIFTSKT